MEGCLSGPQEGGRYQLKPVFIGDERRALSAGFRLYASTQTAFTAVSVNDSFSQARGEHLVRKTHF